MCKTRLVVLLTLFVLLGIILNSCTTPAGRTAGEVVDDTTITTKVKAKLLRIQSSRALPFQLLPLRVR